MIGDVRQPMKRLLANQGSVWIAAVRKKNTFFIKGKYSLRDSGHDVVVTTFETLNHSDNIPFSLQKKNDLFTATLPFKYDGIPVDNTHD